MAITGLIPLNVEFTNTSAGDNLTYVWDFGDGQTSSEHSPVHEYSAPGEFTVTLTTTNPFGVDIKTDTVSATSPGGGGGDTDLPPPDGPPGKSGPPGK